ncbi:MULTISPECIES: DUF3710 domain-containing protein [Corynebacterium]|uniref:DUF3710 domain-containing protein n=1 Tax=Corynebacterium ihumii TaxID=1232427 RepID=A0ABY7UDN5_9CORY|nr:MULTISPECIES: DUF3710 domain-containing protein [Corynebacterium]WCZ34711.1 hypothetical protein CIHUM_06485 [Corynebacterium ihumii]
MAFWPFGKKKKKQQEKSVESSPLEPKQEQPGAQAPAADAEVAPQTEAAEEASPVEKQETAPAAAPVASAAAGVEALTDYDPVGGSTGPFDGDNVDIEDFDFSDFSDVTLNLGSIRVPLPKESQVQVEMGEQGPKMVHVVTRYGRITPVAFAAPRTGGLWEESSEEIIAGMRAEGMPVEIQQGPWGQEIVGTGTNGVIRIIGVEGPRWLYRVTLAAPTGSEDQLAEIGRETVARSFVYRGEDPILAGNSLQVVLPAQLAQQVQAAAETKARQGQASAQAPAEGNPNALGDALKQIIAQNVENQKQLQELRERRAAGGSSKAGGGSPSAAE